MKNITSIIFDLGGVLLDLNEQATHDAFEKIGIGPRHGGEQILPLFHRFEKGEVSPAEFRNTVREYAGTGVSDEQIDLAWNAMLGQLPESKLAILNSLKKDYSLFLLSNTNAIHIAWFENYLDRSGQGTGFRSAFKKIYYSHEIGMRKPEPEIFGFVLADARINPENTLFIDDNTENVRGAEMAGITAVYFDPSDDLGAVLSGILA